MTNETTTTTTDTTSTSTSTTAKTRTRKAKTAQPTVEQVPTVEPTIEQAQVETPATWPPTSTSTTDQPVIDVTPEPAQTSDASAPIADPLPLTPEAKLAQLAADARRLTEQVKEAKRAAKLAREQASAARKAAKAENVRKQNEACDNASVERRKMQAARDARLSVATKDEAKEARRQGLGHVHATGRILLSGATLEQAQARASRLSIWLKANAQTLAEMGDNQLDLLADLLRNPADLFHGADTTSSNQ